MKSKIRYTTSNVMDEELRFKETFAISITGPVAKVLINAHKRDEGLLWHFDIKNQRIDLYHSEMVDQINLADK